MSDKAWVKIWLRKALQIKSAALYLKLLFLFSNFSEQAYHTNNNTCHDEDTQVTGTHNRQAGRERRCS